jgi:putative addiction module killer protein
MLPLIQVEEYVTKEGVSPFAEWFNSLDPFVAAKVNTYLTRLSLGNISSLKPLKGSLQEVVIDWGPGYRVYLGRDGGKLVILLGGGTKKRQQRDIAAAERFWEEYKERRKGH